VGYALIGYYNLIIVAPLLAITVMIHVLGVKTMDLKLRMIEGRRWINLLLGLGLVALGLLVLAGLT
jgi:cytochrome c biogenesis protein CcdA